MTNVRLGVLLWPQGTDWELFEASAKRVEAFHITELESTSRRKRSARAASAVTMASVCCEPYFAMCSIASSSPFTTRIDTTGASHSV